MTHAVRREPPCSTLGRYRLLYELGSGGMAHVYLGLATGLAGFTKLVVLKVMREELAEDSEALNMFLGEARLAARLNHPNIVQTLEVGEDDGCYFIGMEYLEGLALGTLMSRFAPVPLPLRARLEIACQMLDGLTYLHQLADLDGSPLGLVHRDISPGNIFVTFEGTVKVLDFGVAKAAGLSEVSAVGSFKGKLGYAAPEQITGQSDARSDIFTTGLLLWELLSGRRLNVHRTQTEIYCGRITGADADLMRSRGTGLPSDLLEICLKAAAADPAERYQSASTLREALRGYMLAHSLQFSPEQLRGLLAERFNEPRKAMRQRIDQRLKEVQEEETEPATAVATPPLSQAPHVFVDAAEHGSPSMRQLIWKRGLALIVTGGIAAAVGAGLSGAITERSELPGPDNVVGAAASSELAAADVSPEAAADNAASVPSEAPDEQRVAGLEVIDLPVDDRPASGGSPTSIAQSRAVPPRPRARRKVPVRSRLPKPMREAPVQSSEPSRQDAESPAAARLAAPTLSKPGPGDSSGFAHDRESARSARPIDTASPYSN